MAQNIRHSRLESRSTRLRLPVAKKPVFVRVAPSISLGYRRNQTAGAWVVRVADGRGGAWTKNVAIADDHDEADGQRILDFWEAQARAKEIARGGSTGRARKGPLTVAEAADAYLLALEARNARTANDARLRLKRLFLSEFGARSIQDLRRRELETWRDGLVKKTDDPEIRRKSQDTANRVLTIVKALLNHALGDEANGISDDTAWRFVKPFAGVGRAREIHLTSEEVGRLLKACSDPYFRNLVAAGFLTGARYGDIQGCRVEHFDARNQVLQVPRGKTGHRTVILQPDAVRFFSGITKDRAKTDLLLPRKDGKPWGDSHQQRPMEKAVETAGLDPRTNFYALRHSYISRAIEARVPLNVVAENCGTSVRMIEKNYAKVLASLRRQFISDGAPSLNF